MARDKKTQINKIIARELWIQRYRDFRWPILFIGILIFGLVVYVGDKREAGPDVMGTVISLQGDNSDAPKPSRLVVRLDSGAEIIVNQSGNIPFHEGKRVLLKQTITRILGFHRYYFVRYIPDSD
ncbi:hypothetical protein [Kiloniella sp.]|uniref:hypothetical protein n=1 Tax=Kiloniella sp. TaxID=1938587 RepID=UPI003B023FFF